MRISTASGTEPGWKRTKTSYRLPCGPSLAWVAQTRQETMLLWGLPRGPGRQANLGGQWWAGGEGPSLHTKEKEIPTPGPVEGRKTGNAVCKPGVSSIPALLTGFPQNNPGLGVWGQCSYCRQTPKYTFLSNSVRSRRPQMPESTPSGENTVPFLALFIINKILEESYCLPSSRVLE